MLTTTTSAFWWPVGSGLEGHNPSILVAGGSGGRQGSVVNTVIVNNLITGSNTCAICITGGDTRDGQNRVDVVRIVNNTISGSGRGNGVSVYANAGNGTANLVSGLSILNTIVQVQSSAITPEVLPEHVRSSVLYPARRNGFAGVNGNLDADPRFVNPALGDFHLQSGSPAIDAGASDGAPSIDMECRRRGARPDIGAFEFGGLPMVRLALRMAGQGIGTVSAEPAGTACYGATAYDTNETVTLTPVPAAGSMFVGWSGGADCEDGLVTLAQNTTCIATFTLAGIARSNRP